MATLPAVELGGLLAELQKLSAAQSLVLLRSIPINLQSATCTYSKGHRPASHFIGMARPAKRLKTQQTAIEEISFDLGARQEFLTGFHKRKVQRAKHAQEKAEQRARQEKIDDRKKLREDRKAELARHVQAVNDMLKPVLLEVEKSSGEDEEISEQTDTEEWAGIREPSPVLVHREAEYIDEDKYTTVTVETIDVTRHGISRVDQVIVGRSNNSETDSQARSETITKSKSNSLKPVKKPWTKERPADKSKRPKKKRNFRYEGKIERKANRSKERLKNKKQAQARRSG